MGKSSKVKSDKKSKSSVPPLEKKINKKSKKGSKSNNKEATKKKEIKKPVKKVESSSEEESSDEEITKKQTKKPVKKVESSSEEESPEDEAPKKPVKKVTKKDDSSSEEESSDEESSEDEAPKKPTNEEESSDEESSEDEAPKKPTKKAAKKDESSSEEESSDEEEEESSEEEETKPSKKRKRDDGDVGGQPKKANVDESLPPNPDGITTVYCHNLSYDIDEDTIRATFSECGTITNVRWLEDRTSGKFRGAGFLDFEDATQASRAVAKSGEEVLGRAMRCEYAKPKAPRDNNGGGGGGAKKFASKDKTARPPSGTTTIFCGNLSFDIDDDAMYKFFEDCGEIKAIRWLTDRDSGQFKGCGFVEFTSVDGPDAALKKDGETLMGRNIRIDYSIPKERY